MKLKTSPEHIYTLDLLLRDSDDASSFCLHSDLTVVSFSRLDVLLKGGGVALPSGGKYWYE